MIAIALNLDPITHLTREQFYQLCQANRDLQLERTAAGKLIIMSPVGGVGGRGEADLITALGIWNQQTGLGVVFSSSTIFSLPGGSDRSPDVAWVKLERWEALSLEEQEGFPPICPDFVIELRSRTECYSDAVEQASAETGLPFETLPQSCPYSSAEVLDSKFLPE